jgi:hypothetical protein
MTRNQARAYQLAKALAAHEVAAGELRDDDWALLLLAGDIRNPRSVPETVAHRVLSHYAQAKGYFSPRGAEAPTPLAN